MDLIVSVEEAPTGSLSFGGGYGSYDGWIINASVNDKNIFGSGLNIGLSFEHSKKRDTATISLKNPSINDSIYDGSLSIYKKKSTIDADSNSTSGDETKDTKGLSLGIGRSLNRNIRIGTFYSIEDEKLSYELNTSKNSTYVTSSLTPYINYDNTDSYYIPRSGAKIGTSLKIAGLDGDAKYIETRSYFKYFFGLKKYIDYDLILRYKTKVNVLNDRGDIRGKSFYLGGVSSLRGYRSYTFRPDDKENHPFKKTLIQAIELSFPLLAKARIRWALFFDYGVIGENSFNDIEKSGYGALINWYSPVGTIQLIFSRANNPSEDDKDKTSNFEFSLGSTF
jgi:outer membrane protein insertion porin family